MANIAHARQAVAAGKWQAAAAACIAALELVPVDRDATDLLLSIIPKLTPPKGMVLVPHGEYAVGGRDGVAKEIKIIPFGFFIDQKEVTNARYAGFIRATNHPAPPGWDGAGQPPSGSEELPVVNVTWEDARAYAAWAGCALPTEAEWECAARGASGLAYPWGNDWQPNAAVLGFGPAVVGTATKDRSAFGCMDMAGNVAEWTATLPGPEPQAKGSDRPEKVPSYVVKGGSWAGLERGRPTTIVPSESSVRRTSRPRLGVPKPDALGKHAAQASSVVLTSNPENPEVVVRHPANIKTHYVGQYGSAEGADVLVRRWMPEWRQWAAKRFGVSVDGIEPIGEIKAIELTDESHAAKKKMHKVDFSTHCVAIRQQVNKWLEVREPSGVLRRLPYARTIRVQPVKIGSTRQKPEPGAKPPDRAGFVKEKIRADSRMIGRAGGRYINVGFRCVIPIWNPPEQPVK